MIQIELGRLLWRTRGADWDFQFLLRPTISANAAWTEIFSQIFPENQAPRSGVEYRRGCLRLPGKVERTKETFRAAAFMDPARTDTSGRAIQHFFILVGEADPGLDQAGWAQPLLDALGAAYDRVFKLRRIEEESGADFAARLHALFLATLPDELALWPAAQPPPQYLDMGELTPPDRDRPAPPAADPGERPGPPTGALPSGGVGAFIEGGLRALGLLPASRYEKQIAELVKRMAEREGPDAARRLLERLLNDLDRRR